MQLSFSSSGEGAGAWGGGPSDPAPDLDAPREKRAWVALMQVPGIGLQRVRLLVAAFGAPSTVFRVSRSALTRVEGIGEQTAEAILTFNDHAAVDRQMRRAEALGATLLTPWSDRYPRRLREIYDPPAFLWMRGTLTPSDARSVAVVGTRRCTPYGKNEAYRFGQELARRGVTVVSGLAYGIDAAAHRGALDAGGRTLAVLGSGVGNVYPAAHADLADRIVRRGALLSEYALDADPDAPHFPERNRIVSGMTLGTLVVESHASGGALITAGMALDQNREVFALPGDATRSASVGPNRLIQRSQAKLVLDVDDILVEWPSTAPVHAESTHANATDPDAAASDAAASDAAASDAAASDAAASDAGRPGALGDTASTPGATARGPVRSDAPAPPRPGVDPRVDPREGPDEAPGVDLDGDERALYDALGTAPVHVDALCEQAGVDPSAAMVALLHLEFKGLVRQSAGKQFRRV